MSSSKADEAKKKAEYDAQKAERGLRSVLANLVTDAPAPAPVAEKSSKPAKIGEAIAVIRVNGVLQVVSVPFCAGSEFKVLHETNSGPIAAKYFHAEILRRTRELGLTRSLTVEQMAVPDV